MSELFESRAALRAQVEAFVASAIAPEAARAFDEHEQYPHDLLRQLGDLGLMGATIAREYGGLGGDVVDAMTIYEALSRRLPVLAWVAGNIMLYGNDILSTSGSPEQKARYLPELARGRVKFAFALTEPDAGSDAANLSTRATFSDGCYRLTGSKMFITGASVSDIVVTLTRTAPHKYQGITAFLVDTRAPGYSTRPLDKLGYRSSDTCAVHYEDVRVGPEHILGGADGLNQGWGQMVRLLNRERLALSACALGIGQAVVDTAVAYAREHYAFSPGGKGRHQAVQHALVEMATELEAARRLAYHAAWLEIQRRECVREISMSKYFTTETAKTLALRALDLLGRDAADLEGDLQRYLRDVLVLSIGGGTTQIQKNIIARTMGLEEGHTRGR
jgi:alkylation response protein AidB-like acyl-CoA dehydrogenase